MSNFILLGVLAGAQVGLALAEVGCEWVAEVATCTAVSHVTDDSSADALLADAGTCLDNTAAGMQGCEEDLPQCQAVSVAGLSSFGICIPALAVIGTIDVSEAESLFEIENCAGIVTEECDQVRENYYGLLGCPECVPEANMAAAIQSTCAAATTETECAAAIPSEDTEPFTPVATVEAPVDTYDRGFDIALAPEYLSPEVYDTSYEGYYYYGADAPAPEYVVIDVPAADDPFSVDAPAPDADFSYYSYYYYGMPDPEPAAVPPTPVATPLPPVMDDDAGYAYPDTYYFSYGDYPAPYDEVLGPAVVGVAVPFPEPGPLAPLPAPALAPLDLESIDVATATSVEEDAQGPDGVTTSDVREFLGPVLSDGEAEGPATVIIEPFAAAGPGRLASASLVLVSLIAGAAYMIA